MLLWLKVAESQKAPWLTCQRAGRVLQISTTTCSAGASLPSGPSHTSASVNTRALGMQTISLPAVTTPLAGSRRGGAAAPPAGSATTATARTAIPAAIRHMTLASSRTLSSFKIQRRGLLGDRQQSVLQPPGLHLDSSEVIERAVLERQQPVVLRGPLELLAVAW